MATLLPQTLMKLFVVCAMIGVRTFAFLTFSFISYCSYVPLYDFMIIIIIIIKQNDVKGHYLRK